MFNFNLLDIMNSNVYLTNILTIPPIILTFLITQEINQWNVKDASNNDIWDLRHWYGYIWNSFFVLSLFTLVFSNIYHWHMFTDNTFWKIIGEVDRFVTAPLTIFIIILLFIAYFIFLQNTTEHPIKSIENLKEASVPIYVLGIFFQTIGILSWFIKRIYIKIDTLTVKRTITDYKNLAMWTTGHVFFHYMTYTGTLLIILLYYIENKTIYQTLQTIVKNMDST